jgi:UDP-N-acetylmuramoyl-L-alanyl-D-glutamate--2,6-diaminopimelate ligase
MRLSDFLNAGGFEELNELEGDPDVEVKGLAYDSRRVRRGDLFFAVPGAHVDGGAYATAAVASGAVGVVAERAVAVPPGIARVRVKNVRRAMGRCGSFFFGSPSRRLVVVGVTGTNGKTTTTYLLESILARAGLEPAVVGTVNYRYRGRLYPAPQTTPESLDLQAFLAETVRGGARSVAMEISSHALVQERVRSVDFDVAIFTNLTRDHLDFHRDMEDYFAAKATLFTDYLKESGKERKIAVINGGDGRGPELVEMVRARGLETVTYGRGKEWDVHPLDIASGLDGLKGRIRLQERTIGIVSPLIGGANLENIMAAAGAALALGIPPETIAEGVGRARNIPGRMEKIENAVGVAVFVDYAHTPDALNLALSTLRPLTRGRLICVFGCGGDRDRGKRPLMGEIAGRLADVAVLTSDNPRGEEPAAILREIEKGAVAAGAVRVEPSELERATGREKRTYVIEPDRAAAIRLAVGLATASDTVLVAGKGHEDYQIIGSRRIHFDDREEARRELERRAY